MRRDELIRLKVADIDSARMLIHIRQGKGRKDRDVVLSPRLLDELRDYCRRAPPKPGTFLFRGRGSHQSVNLPLTGKSIFDAVQEAAKRAGIKKNMSTRILFGTQVKVIAAEAG